MTALTGVDALKYGGLDVEKVYAGSDLVWQLGGGVTTYKDDVLAHLPDGYWRLGESAGSVLVDSSGNARHGTYHTTVTYGVAGAIVGDADTGVDCLGGGANGGDDKGAGLIPYGAWMNRTTLTAAIWVKHSSSTDAAIYGRWGNDAATKSFGIDISGGSLRGFVGVGGVSRVISTPAAAQMNSAWHLIAITYDGVRASLSIDGSEIGTPISVAGTVQTSLTEPIALGWNAGSSSTAAAFGGQLDEAYFGPALTPAQLHQLYRKGVGLDLSDYMLDMLDGDPAIYWKMDALASPLGDSSGWGRPATANSSPVLGAPALLLDHPDAKSVRFDSAGDSVFRSHESWMTGNNMSIEGWFQVDGAPLGTSATHTFVAKDDYSASFSARGWAMYYTPGVDQLRFTGFVGSPRFFAELNGANPFPIGGPPRYLVGTYDGAVGRLYLDGVEVASEALAGTLRWSAFALQVGKESSNTSNMVGSVDHVALHLRTLDPVEIAERYAIGAALL